MLIWHCLFFLFIHNSNSFFFFHVELLSWTISWCTAISNVLSFRIFNCLVFFFCIIRLEEKQLLSAFYMPLILLDAFIMLPLIFPVQTLKPVSFSVSHESFSGTSKWLLNGPLETFFFSSVEGFNVTATYLKTETYCLFCGKSLQ